MMGGWVQQPHFGLKIFRGGLPKKVKKSEKERNVTFLFSFTSIQQFKSPSLESVDGQKIYLRNDAGQVFF